MAATRKINVRFLGILVGIVAILGPSVYFVNAYQVRRNSIALKFRAQQAFDDGRYDDAARFYYLYLKQHPDDIEARIGRGEALDKKPSKTLGDRKEAFENFQYVLRWDADDPDMRRRQDEIRRRQVDLAFDLLTLEPRNAEHRNQAMAHIRKLLDPQTGTHKNDGVLEQLLALCYALGGEDDQAVTYYEKAMDHAPHHLASYSQFANYLLTRRKDPLKANTVKKRMLAENGDQWEAHLAAAAIARYQGAPDNEEINKALELAPDKAETIREAAAAAQRQHKLDEARALLERGLKLYPANADLYYRLAQVELEARQPDKAEQCLRRGLKEVPEQGQTSLLYLLALSLIQRGDTAQAEKEINNLQNRAGSDIYVNELKARVHMHNQEWSLASRPLERLRTLPMVVQQPEFAFQVEMLLGVCYERQRQFDRALECYEQALRSKPDGPDAVRARRGKAMTLAALGKGDQALGEFRQLLSKDPTVALPMVELLTNQNSRLDPAKRNWQEVDELLKNLERDMPNAPELAILKVRLAQVRQDPREALKMAQAILDKNATQPGPWLNLIQMTENQGMDTLPLIDKAEKALGDRADLRLARARHWLRTGGDEATAGLIKLEKEIGKFSPTDQALLLDGLAVEYLRVGNADQAKRLWTQLAKLEPKNLQVRQALFELAFFRDTEAELDPLIQEIRGIEGETGMIWRYCQACRIIGANRKGKVDRDQLAEARALLTQVSSQRPKWGRVALREAELADLEGNVDNALKSYQRALDLGERDPLSFRRPIYILYQTGHFRDAERMLTTLREQTPELPPDLKRLNILVLSQLGNHAAALADAALPVKRGSKDPGDHFLYATALARAGKNDEAEQAYRTTLQLPGIEKLQDEWKQELWVGFVRFLMGTGQKSKAEGVVQDAAKRPPAEMPPFVLAQCYETINQPAKAEAQYLGALKDNPRDLPVLRSLATFYERNGQLGKAEPYLQRLLESQTHATPADMEMARRALAVTWANTGDYGKFQEGLKLLEQNAKNGVLPIADQHAQAKMLAKFQYRWPDAIKLFEQLENQPGGLLLDEQLALAGLYEFYGANAWVKAKRIYTNVLATNANDANLIYYCTRGLLRHRESDTVPNWLSKLEKLDGAQSPRVLEIRIWLAWAQGKLDQGAKLLQEYVERTDASLDTAATLLEEFRMTGQADELYQKLVEKSNRPESVLLRAAFLGRQGRRDDIQEALELCDKAWKTCPPEKVAHVAIGVLSGIKTPSAQQVQRVERGLQEAMNKNPQSLALQFYMAGLRSLEQKYEEAEKVYRQILQQDPKNALARNNLAWLLAARDGRPKALEALDLINQAIQLVGPSSELLDTRAFVRLKLDAADEALKDLEDARREEEQKPNP
ncbi:MAG TPA: tetratricopeptide repeat protein, partial [Gemmataceae bacterium]|nr:tetratricopeptide repeat protein [Gemmataceae bacterium]